MKTIEIIKQIKQYETIIIHRHVRPDPDALGSQAGLKEIIQASFPEKRVLLTGEDVERFHYLVRMDDVTDDMYEDALVIVTDTANTGRVDDARYTKGKMLIKIDHHPDVDQYGDLQWINPEASSTSEMIFELYLDGKAEGLKLTDEGARLLYAGIVGDTGRFLFPSTSTKTFQYAAELVTFQFDRQALYNNLYSVDMKQLRLQGHILSNFEMSESGLCVVTLTKDILASFDVESEETSQLVGIFSDVEGIKAWVYLIEDEDNSYRARLRSKGPVINEIAQKYDGGGHPLASGATVYSKEEADRLIADLETACREYN